MPTKRVGCSMTRPPVPEAPRQTIRRDPRSSTHRDDGSPLQAGYGHEVYARVSTGGQSVQRQVDELRKASCAEILEETASGADRSRPVLAALLRRIRRGETLVVVKLDRLARSLEHLLEVVRTLEAGGAFLRVLGDPIDTATPQGRFMLQMLGAVAEFERALIRERVTSGLARAAREGRRGGNPGVVARDPEDCAACGMRARTLTLLG